MLYNVCASNALREQLQFFHPGSASSMKLPSHPIGRTRTVCVKAIMRDVIAVLHEKKVYLSLRFAHEPLCIFRRT
jgi:hypothetical protein